MCTASIEAEETRDVAIGETVSLKKTDDGQPFFHRPNDDASLVSCIKHGSKGTFAGLPDWMAETLEVDKCFGGVFVQDPNDASDMIIAENGKVISLYLLFADTSKTTTVEFTFVEMLMDDELEHINDLCVDIFNADHSAMRALSMGNDWSYPFEDTDASTTLTFDHLPTAIDRRGEIIDLKVNVSEADETSAQAEPELEDA